MSTLERIANQGVQIAICSNLAKPYGAALELIEDMNYIRCLSYEIGAIKPDLAAYNYATNTSSVQKENILFVGDNLITDYIGPIEFGFRVRHLVRDTPKKPAAPQVHLITSLNEIFRA
tara:strand:- start:2062 stop:2415 length:354 start_codon:yes stop_codon:yes gene_type:complete